MGGVAQECCDLIHISVDTQIVDPQIDPEYILLFCLPINDIKYNLPVERRTSSCPAWANQKCFIIWVGLSRVKS